MAAQLCACSSIQAAHWMPDGAKPYCSHCLEDFDALNRRARDVTVPLQRHREAEAEAACRGLRQPPACRVRARVRRSTGTTRCRRYGATRCRETRRSDRGRLALRRRLSAPDRAPGHPELRSASAKQPLGPCWDPGHTGLVFRAGATTAAAVAASSAVPAAPILRHCPASASRRRRACASAASPSIPTR